MDLRKIPVEDIIREVASRDISPGGGSVSAFVLSAGAALNLMVINFGISPSAKPEILMELEILKERQERIKESALDLIGEDCVVFRQLMEAIRMKNVTSEKYESAVEVPMKICRGACESMEIALSSLALVKGSILADIACSREILLASFNSARVNVDMNLSGITDAQKADLISNQIASISLKIKGHSAGIIADLRERNILKGDA